MNILAKLPPIVDKSLKRVGRGHGSGKVKTSGRGTKGQKAREKVKLAFAGSSLQASWLKRLPLVRGKGKNRSHTIRPVAINLVSLKNFKAKEITLESLQKAGIVADNVVSVKLLGNGEVTNELTVKVPCSASAKAKIEKAGGKVELK
ncbi:50S ribosomal protein L15 [Candidatus Microgenomates bacterium]|nr:50S ribosomal protein L15 [Candidatus Microgenomates bacterium]